MRRRRPSRRTIGLGVVPVGVTVGWAIYVATTGQFGRAIDHWASALTMVFGSFLAGASPEGGGAVAFPVFTKLLDVPATVARSFGLSIQAVGMSAAAIAIVIARRPVDVRALVVGTVGAVIGFVTALFALGRPDELFWPSRIPTAWVKGTFSLVLASMAILMMYLLRHGHHEGRRITNWNGRMVLLLGGAGLVGGMVSALTGTGTNVVIFMFLVAFAGVSPRVGVPTSIVAMAVVSLLGLVLLGIVDGGLDVTVVDDEVVAVGGDRVGPLEASRFDLFGFWLAAVPVVVWGAPLGSWFVHRIREQTVVRFVAVLAAVEMVTTFVLVDELRSDPGLIAYVAGGLVVLPGAVVALARRRERLLGLTPAD